MEFEFPKFVLILIRITAFIVISPVISMRGIPNTLKVTMAAGLSLVTYMGVPEIVVADSLLLLAFVALKEALVGLALGYIVSLVFSTMQMAGQLIDFQVGFAMSQTYDPAMGINAGIYGTFYYWVSLCAFFILDLHHILIAALIKSFEYVPIGAVLFSGASMKAVLTVFVRIFELALNLAIPMIIVALVVDVVLGVVSRTIPQINVLMLGMPLKIMVSFLAMLVSVSWLIGKSGSIVQLIYKYLDGLMNLL
jgi:flagellar biosynthetic protein FliR